MKWIVTNANHPDFFDIEGDYRICSLNAEKEILEGSGITKEDVESNAKLIAAAPDLLEALKNMVETYEHSRGLLHMEELHPVYHSAKKVLNELEK